MPRSARIVTRLSRCSGMLLPRMLGRRNPPAPGIGPSTVADVVEAIPTLQRRQHERTGLVSREDPIRMRRTYRRRGRRRTPHRTASRSHLGVSGACFLPRRAPAGRSRGSCPPRGDSVRNAQAGSADAGTARPKAAVVFRNPKEQKNALGGWGRDRSDGSVIRSGNAGVRRSTRFSAGDGHRVPGGFPDRGAVLGAGTRSAARRQQSHRFHVPRSLDRSARAVGGVPGLRRFAGTLTRRRNE